MKKEKCLHPQMSRVLKEAGHTDLICVTDAGFPIPENVERVELAWKPGEAKWLEVCGLIRKEIPIEKIFLAEDIKIKSPDMYKNFLELFSDTVIEWISHEELKKMSGRCRAAIHTGEYTSFSNCIITVGVDF